MYHYETKPCSTLQARKHFSKCAKLGSILKVKGYRYQSRSSGVQEAVSIEGTRGKIRFSGLCWGYSGEGPRGLRDLLLFIGLKSELANKAMRELSRRSAIGTDWTIFLHPNRIEIVFVEGGEIHTRFYYSPFEEIIPVNLIAA